MSHVIGWIILVLPSFLKEDTIPRLADEETTANRAYIMCPRSHVQHIRKETVALGRFTEGPPTASRTGVILNRK